MLLSMTGHGDAAGQNERLSVSAEIRSVNNRHLKISVRCPDPFLAMEANIDRLVRESVSRGTLSVHLRIRSLGDLSAYRLNAAVVRQYWQQLLDISRELQIHRLEDLSSLMHLPGIVDEGDTRSVEESDWPLIEEVLKSALVNLHEFRRKEGEYMAAELDSLTASIAENAEHITARAPQVLVDYRDRLENRINDLLATRGMQLEDRDLIREVSIFADRCDITEELTRLRSHLQQYQSLTQAPGASGRKLEFLGQELFREINTIGSKANDIEIAHRVVEMKAAIEKMREIIQNVE